MVDFSDKQLDAEDMLPENWRTSMNHSDELRHFGVKGMKWVSERNARSRRIPFARTPQFLNYDLIGLPLISLTKTVRFDREQHWPVIVLRTAFSLDSDTRLLTPFSTALEVFDG